MKESAEHLQRVFAVDSACVTWVSQNKAFARYRENPEMRDLLIPLRKPDHSQKLISIAFKIGQHQIRSRRFQILQGIVARRDTRAQSRTLPAVAV